MSNLELHLDFTETSAARGKKPGWEDRREVRLTKRKVQKEKYEKRKGRNKNTKQQVESFNKFVKSITTEPSNPTDNTTEENKNTFESKGTNKRNRPDQNGDHNHTENPKRQKLFESEKNANYIKPAFDPTRFSSIQALANNLFDETVDVPDLPAQREVHREELFSSATVAFESLKLHDYLVGNLTTIFGHTAPTVVQSKAIPEIMKNADTLIRSQTGSGKTLAYMLPIFNRMMSREVPIDRAEGVNCIVVLPTRELVLQSYDQAVKLTRAATNIVACALTGGQSRKSEKARLRKGVHILLGTPGRLIDHLEKTDSLKDLKNLDTIVLDEADRMLEMGYLEKIKYVYKLIHERMEEGKKIQSILLSATLSENVESLAGVTLDNPTRIVLDEQTDTTEKFAIPSSLSMRVCVVPPKLRLIALAAAVLEKSKTLVFVNTMAEVNFIYEIFSKVGLPKNKKLASFKLHGDMAQADRVEQLGKFLAAEKGVLIATDVAARGLDLPKVENIVQFSPPGSARDYVQRIGRTARKGNFGQSLLFLLPTEVGFLSAVAAVGAGQWEQLQPLEIMRECFQGKFKGKFDPEQKLREDAAEYQNHIESYIAENDSLHSLAIEGYCGFIRSYAAYPTELKPIFHVKKLHLGHLAKSFGIREKPSEFLKGREDLGWASRREDAGAFVDKNTKTRQDKAKERRKQAVDVKKRALILSEFDAGI